MPEDEDIEDPELDAEAERFADLVMELAEQPGPHRYNALMMADLIPPRAVTSQRLVAAINGITREQLRLLERRALKKSLRKSLKILSENQP